MFNTPAQKTQEVKTHTYNGGGAIERKKPEELALTILGSYMDTDTFYETQDDRIKRITSLVKDVDDSFIEKLAVVARNEFNLRTPPSVLLALKTLKSGQPLATTTDRVFLRGDETMEYLAAVKALSDKKKVIPSAKKVAERGLQKLTERSALRYSGGSKVWSMSDALRVVHPTPLNDKQSALFKFVVAKEKEGSLVKAWETLSESEKALLPVVSKAVSGEDGGAVSWERARSAGEMDWTKVIGDMGYMAILRNLRNFLSEVPATNAEFWNYVLAKIVDPKEIANSKQMPYRFYTAYRAVDGNSGLANKVRAALAQALNQSAWNIPQIGNKTVVAVDVSGSMSAGYMSNRNRSTSAEATSENISCMEIAALFGAAAAISQGATLVVFGETAAVVPVGHDVLTTAQVAMKTYVGHSTNVHAVSRVVNMNSFDTFLIFTDGQFNDDGYGYGAYGESQPNGIFNTFKGKIFFTDLTGYKPGFALSNKPNVRTLGGFSDAVLKIMALDSKGGIVEYIRNSK